MVKHDHKYNGCKHSLDFCGHCDVVFCTKCNKEWTSNSFNPYVFRELEKIADQNKKKVPLPWEFPYKPVLMASGKLVSEYHTHAES